MKSIDALARMPQAPGVFTLAQFHAVTGGTFRQVVDRIGKLRAAGLLVNVTEARGANVAVYQRTAVDLDAHQARMRERIRQGPFIRWQSANWRTPATNSVFSIAR